MAKARLSPNTEHHPSLARDSGQSETFSEYRAPPFQAPSEKKGALKGADFSDFDSGMWRVKAAVSRNPTTLSQNGYGGTTLPWQGTVAKMRLSPNTVHHPSLAKNSGQNETFSEYRSPPFPGKGQWPR